MRKAAAALVAVVVGVAGFVACQPADRTPVGPSVPQSAATSEDGPARAAADPVPVPGKPAPVPIPGRGGSGGTTTVPVPGAPPKGGFGGGGGGGTPGPTPTPTPGATPTPAPATQRVTFVGPGANTTGSPLPRIQSLVNVQGITGRVTRIVAAFQLTVSDALLIENINLRNPNTASIQGAASLYSETRGDLTGSALGTNCSAYGGATTIDDTITVAEIASGAPPYAGVFAASPDAPMIGLIGLSRFPADTNGNWMLEFLFESGATARLECWTLIMDYEPAP